MKLTTLAVAAFAVITTPALADIFTTETVGSAGAAIAETTAPLSVKIEKMACRSKTDAASFCNHLTTGLFGLSVRGAALSARPDEVIFSMSDLSEFDDLMVTLGAVMLALDPDQKEEVRFETFKEIILALADRELTTIEGQNVLYTVEASSNTQGSIKIAPR